MAKLNGWQRRWGVLTCAWGVLCLGFGITMAPTVWYSGNISPVFALLAFAVVPPMFFYVAGLVVAWIWRGFRS